MYIINNNFSPINKLTIYIDQRKIQICFHLYDNIIYTLCFNVSFQKIRETKFKILLLLFAIFTLSFSTTPALNYIAALDKYILFY